MSGPCIHLTRPPTGSGQYVRRELLGDLNGPVLTCAIRDNDFQSGDALKRTEQLPNPRFLIQRRDNDRDLCFFDRARTSMSGDLVE